MWRCKILVEFTSIATRSSGVYNGSFGDKSSNAEEKVKLVSKDKCYCIFSAPGPNMLIHEQNPVTNLTIFIKRANIVNDKEHSIIPDPMFEPLNETNIDKKTAISFEVKEGDYIQII